MPEIPTWLAAALLVVGFAVLAKGSGWLVDGAVGIAERLNVPKLLIGIILVGFATTAPEFAVSIISALSGKPEMALGNAVGSVIVDDGVALALVGLLAATPVIVNRRLLVQTGAFLVAIDVLAFVLAAADGTLSRAEGGTLLACFFAYLAYVIWDRVRRPASVASAKPTSASAQRRPGGGGDAGEAAAGESKSEEPRKGGAEDPEGKKAETPRALPVLVAFFVIGLALVIGASKIVVTSAVLIAAWAGISEAVIALTVVAIGTSLPEIATCIVAARKGEGALAVGDIIGADVLNIAWIAGASALANPLTVDRKVIYFMFPAMLVIVLTMLAGLLWRRRMTRGLGAVLVAEYVVYMGIMFWLFPPGLA